MNYIERAEQIATEAHQGQFRRDGVTPYITHPRRVAELARAQGLREGYVAVAWLHDVIEDSKWTGAMLWDEGFTVYQVEAVVAMTHRKGESYDDYLLRVAHSPMAVAVKVCDIVANLTDAPSKKQIDKYTKALHYLAGV